MGSFPTDMHSHITLQTKGTTVFLTVKESYIHVYRKEKYLASCKSSNCKLSHTENIKHTENSIPGAFSHMSQRGTLEGSASPTRTCLLASLLHKWTCKSRI